MMGVLLALLASVGWGASAVLARPGLQQVKPAQGTLISMVASFALVAGVTLLLQREALARVSAWTVVWFALIGLLNFPMGRFFNYLGLSYIGVSRSTPVLASSPLFAMALAVVFTGETVTVPILIGTLALLVGLYLVMSDRGT